ncbi:MAG TPA: signal peptidase I [Woeseiaceae bacterium]|nr:signal peptidase I [Woeseiaceae bacterium]
MDLALILTVLTVFSGLVVAVDRFWLRRRVAEDEVHPGRAVSLLVEYSRSFFPVLLLVLVIRSFIFEPFRIPSGSMRPTLLQGDYIFVTKYSYGLRLPVLNTEILETGSPDRGDVVVFRLPSDPSINYIKRVVGIPGDKIVYRDHELSVNGEHIPTHPASSSDSDAFHDLFIEDLGSHKHEILLSNRRGSREGEYRVPEGHYFMLGDNRDNSQDSRFIGMVPEANLVGRAVRIWMHMDGLEWPDWGRIGTRIE